MSSSNQPVSCRSRQKTERHRILLLISDLHLHQSRPDITEGLVWFLTKVARGAQRLYILGDLFEVWIGDDAPDLLADLVADELKKIADAGTELYLMHGNRDFLIGEDYAVRCGASLVEEPLLLNVASRRIALLHGDVLCTRDTDYLKFRQMVRNPQWQSTFLSQTVEQRQEFARQAREQSKKATSGASMEIMDVTENAVLEMFQQLQIDTMIHGHTHRPMIHDIATEDSTSTCTPRQRVVLGDWDRYGWYGQIDGHGDVSLHKFDLPAKSK